MRTTTLLSGALLALALLGAASAPAQHLPVHPIRSISPTDTAFQDLAFLKQEIGAARVVMVGEPTHGEGNVTEAKIRLIRFLQQRMGFTTVAFESGLYELDHAQRGMEAGTSVAEAIDNSVFNVWTSTQEFRALLPLLGRGKLRVAGFDSQTGYGPADQLEELEAFLKPEQGADGIAYDYLDECLSTMAEQNIFPPSHQIVLFDMQLGKARKMLQKVVAGPDARRRERAAFWLQNLRSIQAAAHDYAANDPAAKDSASFTALDSNPRDAQMADNLLWYLRQHPREKVICWGALPHFANKAEVLDNDELRQYRPMGRAVKAALGPDAVYILGTLSGSGTYGSWGKVRPVPPPAPGTLEADLLAQGHAYSFVSLKHDAPGRPLTTHAFEYKPLTGPWSEVVDGFLFLRSVNPPHSALAAPETAASATPPAATAPPRPTIQGKLPLILRPTPGSGAAFALSGTVLDRKTGQPVPFATVAAPSRSAGTVTDAQGRFRLEVRPGETVQLSSIGYEPATLAAQPTAGLTVRLAPAAFALADVRVSAQSQDPKRIMRKVIQAAEKNYNLGHQTSQVYVHRQISNFDTVRYDGEYVMNMLVPEGFHQYMTFLRPQPWPEIRVQEMHFLVHPSQNMKFNWASTHGHGMTTHTLDVMRLSPLFQVGSLNRYILRLDTILHQGTETTYVVGFRAKKANKRTVGTTLQVGYQGRLFIQERDYAVVRYEALWQGDTAWYNAAAHKYFGRTDLGAKIFSAVYTDWRNAHTSVYTKWSDGRYRLTSSVGSARAIGRDFKLGAFYYQSGCGYYFTPLPAGVTAPSQTLGSLPEAQQTKLIPYHPEFWQTYQRPAPAEPAPTLEATKP